MMQLDNDLKEIAIDLIIHFINDGTIKESKNALASMGLPLQIVEKFPGMIYDSTAAAISIITREKEYNDVIEALSRQGAKKLDVMYLVDLSLDTVKKNTI